MNLPPHATQGALWGLVVLAPHLAFGCGSSGAAAPRPEPPEVPASSIALARHGATVASDAEEPLQDATPEHSARTDPPFADPPHVSRPSAPLEATAEPLRYPHVTAEEPQPTKTAGVPRGLPELEPFYDRLDRLVAGETEETVRVLWLGDSHTAADFMTQPVRSRLVEVGGDGGPGFLSLGLDQYRHGQAKVEKFGRWRHQPIQPSQRTRILDGVFGYAGQRTIPTAGAEARVRLRSDNDESPVRWIFLSRLGPGDRLEISAGKTVHVLTAIGQVRAPQSTTLTAPAFERFVVKHRAGAPEVFGVIAERVRAGVVLDTLGINGARAATPLAWEAAQYEQEVRNRQPALFVLAYGTNEAFDNGDPERYADHYRELLSRLRRATPGVPCWMIGPPDALTKDGRSLPRLALINLVQSRTAKELGCAFTSAQSLMGGEGSFERWMHASPPRARGDRVHLTIAGYQALGEALAEVLLPRPSRPPI